MDRRANGPFLFAVSKFHRPKYRQFPVRSTAPGFGESRAALGGGRVGAQRWGGGFPSLISQPDTLSGTAPGRWRCCVHLEAGSLAQSQCQPAATRVSWAEIRLSHRTETQKPPRPDGRRGLTLGHTFGQWLDCDDLTAVASSGRGHGHHPDAVLTIPAQVRDSVGK